MKKNLIITASALLLSSTFSLSFADEHSDICAHKDKAKMCQEYFDAKKMKVTEKDINLCVEGMISGCKEHKNHKAEKEKHQDEKSQEMFNVGINLTKNPKK